MVVLISLSLKILLCCNKQARINAMAFLQEIVNLKVAIFSFLTTQFSTNEGKHWNNVGVMYPDCDTEDTLEK